MSKTVASPNQSGCNRLNEMVPPAVIANEISTSPASESLDFDDYTSSSILEFLNKEKDCSFYSRPIKDASEINDEDAESIFREVNRLVDKSDTRSVDEILREAEILMSKQEVMTKGGLAKAKSPSPAARNNGNLSLKQKFSPSKSLAKSSSAGEKLSNGVDGIPNPIPAAEITENVASAGISPTKSVSISQRQKPSTPNNFDKFMDNLMTDSIISDESTPKDMRHFTAIERDTTNNEEDDDDATDTLEDITECIDSMELQVNDYAFKENNTNCSAKATLKSPTIMAFQSNSKFQRRSSQHECNYNHQTSTLRQNSPGRLKHNNSVHEFEPMRKSHSQVMMTSSAHFFSYDQIDSSCLSPPVSPMVLLKPPKEHFRSPESITPTPTPTPIQNLEKTFCDKSTNSSPKHYISTVTSPIESISAMSREHVLKQEIEQLQEKLKDTEERLQSLRIQHDSLSQLHRDLRENNTRIQEESEILKLDVQHLNECANILRSELQSARNDRNEALDLQRSLQQELEESRNDRKRAQDQKEKDAKTIQDLHRQCREMERILMRKHPDSVSALIVASKNPGKSSNRQDEQENNNSRKLLEQRIAQLEADAKEQDAKAQKILANVQARFNSVQSKYETHIADLETQVLSLQEINTKLNEKIESQIRTLDYFVAKKAEKFSNSCSQTEEIPEREVQMISSHTQTLPKANDQYHLQTAALTNALVAAVGTNTIAPATQTASTSTNSTANSTPNTSRPNSKQSGLKKPTTSSASGHGSNPVGKLPFSHSDSTISAYHAAAKEDAHLLATIRGMRVDLAIKDKAMQRLTRELDECKKTIRKLQKEKDALKSEKTHNAFSSASSSSRKAHDDQSHDSQSLREAQNRLKLLENDYKALHDKRLQDLKNLQTAHERELASCQETIRILQQRLSERDEAFAMQKRRKVPVDYYALKAKVSSLERRHSEREERLHLLVEALSKGRLNGALDDILGDNNNQ